mgnify:CR=1 FL=1
MKVLSPKCNVLRFEALFNSSLGNQISIRIAFIELATFSRITKKFQQMIAKKKAKNKEASKHLSVISD